MWKYQQSLTDVVFTTDEEMMAVAIKISATNVKERTGGPFGCAIFERDTTTKKSKLFSVGANRKHIHERRFLHSVVVRIIVLLVCLWSVFELFLQVSLIATTPPCMVKWLQLKLLKRSFRHSLYEMPRKDSNTLCVPGTCCCYVDVCLVLFCAGNSKD